MPWVELAGYVASSLVFLTFYMRRMVPLRLVALCSNVAFLTYALALHLAPIAILHGALIPVNIVRLIGALHEASTKPRATQGIGPSCSRADLTANSRAPTAALREVRGLPRRSLSHSGDCLRSCSPRARNSFSQRRRGALFPRRSSARHQSGSVRQASLASPRCPGSASSVSGRPSGT